MSSQSPHTEHTPTNKPRQLLVNMLNEAAQLEHCLLDAYLYAACSLKSTPQEFAQINGLPNKRRAVQFERVRGWKTAMMSVAHEEMRHLHYTQCMIRALGERPSLGLPPRDAQGNWYISNWDARLGDHPISPEGVPVPVTGVNEDTLRRFVVYESTDALQDEDPFGPKATALFDRLYAFELAMRLESMLQNMPAGPDKQALQNKLVDLYQNTLPLDAIKAPLMAKAMAGDERQAQPPRFQSIGDFYTLGVLPLFEQAFKEGWVTVGDRNLVDEQLNPNYAAEGFLPVGPVGRSARFSRLVDKNNVNPLADYKNIAAIIQEIVAEGEGTQHFMRDAQAMLDKVDELGITGYLQALAADAARGAAGKADTPEWLAKAQRVRKSHLYVFAMMLVEHRIEDDLSRQCGTHFDASRQAVTAGQNVALAKLSRDLPAQFNACYIAMLAWLARMYESRTWASDKPRRMAIEMVATWPLMSLAIRPFLELASFFAIDTTQLFRVDADGMPALPVWANELVELYQSIDRSEAINERMDWLVTRTLSGAAQWAAEQIAVVNEAQLDAQTTQMLTTRLAALSRLDEFERQFPYRVAGGYSDRSPDLAYRNAHPDSAAFEENPTSCAPLFADGLVMRLRFRGWGLVQLATDPDPPTDESGSSGTIMLHAADGNRRLDRALVFQDFDPQLNIRRAVAHNAPPLGVDCVEATLMAPELVSGAVAGYKPLQILQSTGAVQTNGVQQMATVQGLHEVASVDLSEGLAGQKLKVFLDSKQGQRPFLVGDNHLLWQDGEPIDPFIVSVYADGGQGQAPQRLLGREVYNQGKTFRQMEPYQRLLTARGPAGFDASNNLPDWAITPQVTAALSTPQFPRGFLRARSQVLIGQLQDSLAQPITNQDGVDQAVSLAERLLLVAQPKGTTVGWLTVQLRYGHTVSGDQFVANGDNPMLAALSQATGLSLQVASASAGQRDAANARWLVTYAKGLMDVDALSDFVYGELYIPLQASGQALRFSREWRFPAGMRQALVDFACNFQQPFWATFEVAGDTRSVQVQGLVPNEPRQVSTLVETLQAHNADGYSYSATGFPGMGPYAGRFVLATQGDDLVLRWEVNFTANQADAIVPCYELLAASADTMGQALARHFSGGSMG